MTKACHCNELELTSTGRNRGHCITFQSHNGWGASMHRNNRAAFLRQIEHHSADRHLRPIVLLLKNYFFGVFPSHVGQMSCVLCAYLWRPSLINTVPARVRGVSLFSFPITHDSPQFLSSPFSSSLCPTHTLLPPRPTSKLFLIMP